MNRVEFNSNKKEASGDEILIGLGDPHICKKCINKTVSYNSCSEYLYDNFFGYDNETIVIEDFSVDTIVTIYMLIYGKVDRKYVDYASRYESGESDDDIFRSYGVLQGSLIQTLDGDETYKVERSLEFLDFLIKSKYDLWNIPYNKNRLYKRAYKKLREDYDRFNHLICESETYTLEVNKRKVKAIFVEHVDITPLIKMLLRRKFCFIASFNEEYKGTGNDVVISVSPESGLNLKELWVKLEEEETRKWKGNRPNDKPRKIVSTGKWNEPWWDDMGKYTLIAAPKKTGETYGSKLNYDEIKDIILKVYNGKRE